jgi:hypothetical protein
MLIPQVFEMRHAEVGQVLLSLVKAGIILPFHREMKHGIFIIEPLEGYVHIPVVMIY